MVAILCYGSNDWFYIIVMIYYMGIYFEKDQFDLVVDISDWFEKCVEVELMFKSQGYILEYVCWRIIVIVGNIGWFSGCTYVEVFVQSKFELLMCLLVSECAMRWVIEFCLKYMWCFGGEFNEDV